MLAAREGQQAAIGQTEQQFVDVFAETAMQVMILAMHIAGYSAADRDEAGARRYREEPAARQQKIQ